MLYSIWPKNRENTENYHANMLKNRLKMEKLTLQVEASGMDMELRGGGF